MNEKAGTELYRQFMAGYGEQHDGINRKVWSPTPWMIDVFAGAHGSQREREIIDWCFERWGAESFHGSGGHWHRGNATIFGWTWFGFSTEAEMNEFKERWPTPNDAPPRQPLNLKPESTTKETRA